MAGEGLSIDDYPKIFWERALEELGIVVVPLIVRIGHEEFPETALSRDEYWTKVEAARAQGLFPQTSQPSVGAFERVFDTLVGEGNEVICVTITSKHSGTLNSAWAAAQRFSRPCGLESPVEPTSQGCNSLCCTLRIPFRQVSDSRLDT